MSALFIIWLTVALSSLWSNVLCDQAPFATNDHGRDEILDDSFSEWIEAIGHKWGMKGVAIAVTRKNKNDDGWITETKGYGVANRNNDPVDAETLFCIASNSKLFTALGVGLLVANESVPLEWETKVKSLLPNALWDLQDPFARDQANLVDILSHRTGISRHELSYDKSDTAESGSAKLRYLKPSAEFRNAYQYTNQMYAVADLIIANLSGTPFVTYITENIISPAGMNSTTYDWAQAQESGKFAEGFVSVGEDEELGEGKRKLRFRPIQDKPHSIISGAGGVLSNVNDMARWLQVLLLLGKTPETEQIGSKQILPSEIIEKVAMGVSVVTQSASGPDFSPILYGMGQQRYTYQGHELIEHGGALIAHFSSVIRAPHDGLGIAILTNAFTDGPLLSLIKWKLLEKSLGLRTIDWDARFTKQLEEKKSPRQPPCPSDGSPLTLPLDRLAGVYYDQGYGALTLCPYSPSLRIPLGKDCEGVIPDSLLPMLDDSSSFLVASWPKIWSSHLILRHISGDCFGVTAALEFPAPSPDSPITDDDSRPFAIVSTEVPSDASAEFVFLEDAGDIHVEGLAAWGLRGEGTGVADVKREGKENAEVWYDRVV
ncbi:beta-lactamase/transpeptidase-like protein [Ramaria rubella]|nr:beta-lactamase/transpeptidase-like protein [Ramaria rubella]